ncbi:MAG: hypothetical protein ACRDPD_07035 [Streptosporangiaceae bacterium]
MPRPPTGKTPVRNHRSPDETWLPALAKTVADGTTMTDLINPVLAEYGSTPPDRGLTFAERPDALPWLEASFPAWRDCADAIAAATGGLAEREYAGVAVWLALTHSPASRRQQKRVIAGFVLLRANTAGEADLAERTAGGQALIRAVNGVLDQYLPPPRRREGPRAGRLPAVPGAEPR